LRHAFYSLGYRLKIECLMNDVVAYDAEADKKNKEKLANVQ
jgi:hypothetical protein